MAGIQNNDVQIGRAALMYWHNAALTYPENYQKKFSTLESEINKKIPSFFDGFGFAIRSAGLSDSRVRSAMEKVANDGEGRFPVSWMAFFNAVSNEATKVSFVAAISETASDSADDIVSGFQRAGNAVIETAKNAEGLVTLVPLLLFAGLGFYIYRRAK